MADDEFSCEKFQPQKWRKDVCRNCYQPLRKHASRPDSSPLSPTSPGGGGAAGKEAKVFQRFRVNKEKSIDRSVPARERTPLQENLTGISAGKVASVVGGAPANQVQSPSPAENSVPSPPPSSSSSSSSVKSVLPKPKPPPVSTGGGAPFVSPKSPVSKPTANHAPLVAKVTPPSGMGAYYPRSTSGTKIPSRPPPPASAIHKPPPPATVGAIRGPLSTKTPSPTPPTTTVPPPVQNQTTVTPTQQLPTNENKVSPVPNDSNKFELTTEVKESDSSSQELLAKEEESKTSEMQSKTNDLEQLTRDLPPDVIKPVVEKGDGDLPADVIKPVVEQGDGGMESGDGLAVCNGVEGGARKEGEGESGEVGEQVRKEGEGESEEVGEEVKEEETAPAPAMVEEVMEVIEMRDSATKLESSLSRSLSDPDSSTHGGGEEGEEGDIAQASTTGGETEAAAQVSPEVVGEMSEVAEMEREEGESVAARLQFAVSQLTEPEKKREEVAEAEKGDIASTEPDVATREDEGEEEAEREEEEEGEEEGEEGGEEETDGGREMMKSFKRRLSIKKKPKKAASDATENSPPREQGIHPLSLSHTTNSSTPYSVVHCMASHLECV